jgi:N-acetylmuramoyl-L-alanine amidase
MKKRRNKILMQGKRWGLLILTVLITCLVPAFVQASPLNYQTTRLYGATRIETAIEVSKAGWPSADTVLLARADDFPDSLVAIPLAKKLNSPILLTYPTQLDPQVLTEIKRLGATKVILLGTNAVLGSTVSGPLKQAGLAVENIGGADRYATAALIAERVGGTGQVVVASGEQGNFPDALAIGPYAAVTQSPILLTRASSVPDVTRSEISKLQAGTTGTTIVVGGDGVANATGLTNVNRIFGQDRYETAEKVYFFAQDKLPGTVNNQGVSQALLVTGQDFPDALVAGALAGKQSEPLFMTSNNYLPATTYSAMSSAANQPLMVTIIGSSGVISDQVKGNIEGTVQPTYLLAGKTIVVDPGHGGPDPGAIGLNGTYEKNNTLATGLMLADYLRSAGAKVVMTRSTDVSVATGTYSQSSDLQARVDIANNIKADLFISIHNNSATSQLAYGTETYYSSGSTAANQSLRLGQSVQAQVVQQIGLYNRGVKDAAFVVINKTTMPAVLVELGFISNLNETAKLCSPDFQNRAAFGIYRGILVYQGY